MCVCACYVCVYVYNATVMTDIYAALPKQLHTLQQIYLIRSSMEISNNVNVNVNVNSSNNSNNTFSSTNARATTQTETILSPTAAAKKQLVLRLKEDTTKVSWTDDTVDNEKLNKKSSKRCCIYHKTKKFGESDSDESDSDTEIAIKERKNSDIPNFQRHHA